MLLSAVFALGLLASACARDEQPASGEDALMMDWGNSPETWQELLRQFDYPVKDTVDTVKKVIK